MLTTTMPPAIVGLLKVILPGKFLLIASLTSRFKAERVHAWHFRCLIREIFYFRFPFNFISMLIGSHYSVELLKVIDFNDARANTFFEALVRDLRASASDGFDEHPAKSKASKTTTDKYLFHWNGL